MKKKLVFIASIISIFGTNANCKWDDTHFFFELRPGAWIFQEKLLRDIYARSIATFQSDIGLVFKEKYSLGVGGQYMQKKGSSLICPLQYVGSLPSCPFYAYFAKNDVKSELKLGHFSLFCRYHFLKCCDCIDFYIGAGPRVYFYRVNNKSCCVQNESKNGVGGFVSLGMHFCRWDRFYMTGSFDYSIYSICSNPCGSRPYKTCFNGATFSLGLGIDF